MRKLPKVLDDILYTLNKKVWDSGEVDTIIVPIYDFVVKGSQKLKYDVTPHDEYLAAYQAVLDEEKKDKRIKRNMFLFP